MLKRRQEGGCGNMGKEKGIDLHWKIYSCHKGKDGYRCKWIYRSGIGKVRYYLKQFHFLLKWEVRSSVEMGRSRGRQREVSKL